jgi:hypothetical protein
MLNLINYERDLKSVVVQNVQVHIYTTTTTTTTTTNTTGNNNNNNNNNK